MIELEERGVKVLKELEEKIKNEMIKRAEIKKEELYGPEIDLIKILEPVCEKSTWWQLEHELREMREEVYSDLGAYDIEYFSYMSFDKHTMILDEYIWDGEVSDKVFKILTQPLIDFYTDIEKYSVEIDPNYETITIIDEEFDEEKYKNSLSYWCVI